MPKIEIVITEGETKMLHKKLDDLFQTAAGGIQQKQNMIPPIHHYIKQLIHEAYELGKDVGNAGLD